MLSSVPGSWKQKPLGDEKQTWKHYICGFFGLVLSPKNALLYTQARLAYVVKEHIPDLLSMSHLQ